MKTMNTVTGNVPTECWIFENHTYQYHSMTDTDLPYTNVSNECILKANGISYRKTLKSIPAAVRTFGEVCEYWDSKIFEERDVSAPLFAAMPNHTWRYCEKNYTGKVVTKETIDAADKLTDLVQSKIAEYENILLEVSHYQYAKRLLEGDICKVCHTMIFPSQCLYEIDMNHDSFVVFGIYNGAYGSYLIDFVAIFDKNKIVPNGYITLQVPKPIAGMVIGTEGRNIKSWANYLKVKYIKVIPVQDYLKTPKMR